MHIDKFKQADGTFVAEDGAFYESAEDFLQTHVLKFCGCGNLTENLKFVRDVLRHISDLKEKVWPKAQECPNAAEAYDKWNVEGDALMGRSRWFMRYFLDREGFTEHGGSIGGAWLTSEGQQLLEDLDELFAK